MTVIGSALAAVSDTVKDRGVVPEVPLVTVGGLGGTLETGRILDYLGKSDEERKLCSLHLALMQRMGVKAERFGDTAGVLAGL